MKKINPSILFFVFTVTVTLAQAYDDPDESLILSYLLTNSTDGL